MGRYSAEELTLAIDFDGTLTLEANIFADILPCADALDFVKFMDQEKVRLILWTCRTGEHLTLAMERLKEWGIGDCFSSINSNSFSVGFKTSAKVFADYYIDDFSIDWVPDQWSKYVQKISMDSFFKAKYAPGVLLSNWFKFKRREIVRPS